jgi:predicted Zn-dependent protease with MMP-like domain
VNRTAASAALLTAWLLVGCTRPAGATAPQPRPPSALADEAEAALAEGNAEQAVSSADAALRALEVRPRAPRRDRALEVRLLVAAATAENDLGRPDLALPRAERALRLAPEDAGAAWERALALWELCRFDDAEPALRRVLELAPDDAWATHYLGLAAERRGDLRRAKELLAAASRLAPDDFPAEVDVDAASFAAEVKRALAALPAPDRKALASVPLELAELPEVDDLVAVEPPLSPGLLGLFRGPSEQEPCLPEDGEPCRSIVLYRRNLVRYARDRAELSAQVRVTLLHELGHLRGEDDEALRRRGLE